jgi:NADPH2:quinone reductase
LGLRAQPADCTLQATAIDCEEIPMKAAVYYENGDPNVFRYEDVPDPKCQSNGIVIRVEAVSIEGGDTLNRLQGALTAHPHIVGYQAAGEIIEVGPEVHDLMPGQKVVTVGFNGSHASLRAVPARTAWPIPKGANVQHAAAVPVPFGTAHDCLFEFGHLKSGETVLVQAGASGVGVAAIQLAKRAGARVLASASSDDRLEKLKALGLDRGINYKRENLVATVMKITDNQGVNLVVDPVGGPTLEGSLLSLAYRGRVSMVGAAGREPMRIDVSSLMAGNRTLSGVFLGAEIASDRVHDNIQRLIDEVASGTLKVVIDRTFPLKNAAEAHAYIESRKAVGRVLLIP